MLIGEAIIVERPYAISLRKEFYNSHCSHCCRRLERKVSCPNNCEVGKLSFGKMSMSHLVLTEIIERGNLAVVVKHE